MKYLLIFFILIKGLPTYSQVEENLYSPTNTKKYADYLFQTKQFKAAAIEYERYWILNGGSDTSIAMTLKSLRLSGDYESGIKKISSFYLNNELRGIGIPDGFIYGSKLQNFAFNEFLSTIAWNGNYETAKEVIAVNRVFSKYDSLRHLINFSLLSLDLLKTEELFKLAEGNKFSFSEQSYLYQKARQIKYKKPWLAASMSAIIPGSGKVYSGDWKDGAFSFLTIGLLGYQAYKGFSHDGIKSPLGIITGTMALGFYGANIYGSAKAVRNYNKQKNESLINEARNLLYPSL